MASQDNTKHKLNTFIASLEKRKIRLLAVDFDQTLISIHSGGVWKDSTEKLTEHIRPCVRDVMDCAMQKGIHVCIVTYFMQPWVIREMLKLVFKRDAGRILVQANTREFQEKHKYQFLGKEAHISAVCTELYKLHHTIIKPEEIILLDDDVDNVNTALEFGHWAVEVKEDISYDSFVEFSKLFTKKLSRSKSVN